jgi:hypothetical protein
LINLPAQSNFGPDELARMKEAFEEVWMSCAWKILTRHQQTRDAIASAIIKAASEGERDLAALIDAGTKALAGRA